MRDTLADCLTEDMTAASQLERTRRFLEPVFEPAVKLEAALRPAEATEWGLMLVSVGIALAGLLLVEESGGRTWSYPGKAGLAAGGAVLASATGLFDDLARLARLEL